MNNEMSLTPLDPGRDYPDAPTQNPTFLSKNSSQGM